MLDFAQLSYWEKETYINHTDFLIIGSGIVGLSTALHLKQRFPGKKVTILERGYLPSGASSKNAGFACIGSPSEILDDLRTQSAGAVFSTVERRWKGLHYLRQLLGDEAIGFKALGSHEIFAPTDKTSYLHCLDQLGYLNGILKKITGIASVFKPEDDLCTAYGFKGFDHAISHAAEGQINTGQMIKALALKTQSAGVNLLNGISVEGIDGQKAKTNHGSMTFDKAFICTNGFAGQFLPDLDLAPARAQVIVTSPIPDLKPRGIFHFNAGYYYFRSIGDRILFGGGRNTDIEGETTTQLETTAITNHLEHLLRTAILPEATFEITHRWAGIMGVGKSKTPIIQQIDDHLYCGVRLGGMGVAIGSLVGKELAECCS